MARISRHSLQCQIDSGAPTLSRDGMDVMEGDHVGVGPERRLRRSQLVRAERIGRIWRREERHEVRRCMCPTLVVQAVINGAVIEDLNLPDAVLPYEFILVDASFPPLRRHAGSKGWLAFVTAGLHEAAKAAAGRAAVRRDIDDVLQLQMVEQKPVHRSVVSGGEVFAKAIAVKAPKARLRLEDAAHEPYFALFREKVHDFVVKAFIEIVYIGMLEPADGMHVAEDADLVRELRELPRQADQFIGAGHCTFSHSGSSIGFGSG